MGLLDTSNTSIDAQENDNLSTSTKIAKTLILPMIFVLIFIGLFIISKFLDYNVFHIPVEFFSIFVAWTIFTIAWNSRRFSDNRYFLFISISFLFIGIIDFFHTLAYKGLNLLPDVGAPANLATELWILARYFFAISFLLSIIFINRFLKEKLIVIAYFIATIFSLFLIFSGIFPDCFDVGLTPFKILSEFVIIGILSITIVLHYLKRENFDPDMLQMVIIAIIFTIASELSFILYSDVYGIANFIGHLLKILSFYWIYKALIQVSLNKPYDFLFLSLAKRERNYRRIFENSPIALKEEDFSNVKVFFDKLKKGGVEDFRVYFNTHPKEVRKCASLVKTLNVNRDFLNLYKATSTEQLKGGLDKIFIEESYNAFKEELITLAEGNLSFESESTTRTLEGNKNYIYFRILVVPGYEETLSRVLISVLDKTKQIEFENLRRQFVFTVSHELRTPISVISQSISNLQKYKHKLTQEQEMEILMSLSRNTFLLTELVEDLLLLSRFDEEIVQLNWLSYNLSAVLLDVLSQLEPRFKAKNITIQTNLNESIQMLGDSRRIAQIFRIFIDNALKYSAEDTKLIIKAITSYAGKFNPSGIEGVLVQFIDEGRGIREEDIPNLFQRFFRSNDVSAIPGTGLGLSIARELALLHHGDTYVESTYGKGSSFYVFFPKFTTPPPVQD